MLEHAIYSVISPEGCASILWRSADKAQEAAAALNRVRARAGVAPYVVGITTQQQNVVDAVIAERRVELASAGPP